jgi:RNA polymerase sigma factor (sigma-70 family)
VVRRPPRRGQITAPTAVTCRWQLEKPVAPAVARGDTIATPDELIRLLQARTPLEREAAWDAFLASQSRLLLHVARQVIHDRDGAMDAYAAMLEALRADDFARLRGWRDAGRARFTTWFVVVLRRIAVDHVRSRYGRSRADGPSDATRLRRRLQDLVGESIDTEQLGDGRAGTQADDLCRAELGVALESALRRLEPRDRLLLALRFDDDLSAAEIARGMGYPTQFHVYRRLQSVLGVLRRELLASGVDGPAS